MIFDCDGVLVDSERLAIHFDADIFTEFGWEITPQEIADRYMGRSYGFMTGDLAERVGTLPADFDERYHRGLDELFQAELAAVPGVADAIDRIEAAGITTCVASSSSHDRLRSSLGLTGLYERFDGRIFSASEVENGKPAPDLFLHAATKQGCEPSRCVVVEDSEYGVQAARSAGMRCFAYAAGLIAPDRLEGTGSTLFSDMRDLPDLLGV